MSQKVELMIRPVFVETAFNFIVNPSQEKGASFAEDFNELLKAQDRPAQSEADFKTKAGDFLDKFADEIRGLQLVKDADSTAAKKTLSGMKLGL